MASLDPPKEGHERTLSNSAEPPSPAQAEASEPAASSQPEKVAVVQASTAEPSESPQKMHSSDDSVLLQRTPKSHSSKAVSKAAMRATLNGRITGLSFEKLPPPPPGAPPPPP